MLLLNAGIAQEYNLYMGPHDSEKVGIWQHPTEDWRRLSAVNLDGVYFGGKIGAKSMVHNKVKEAKSIVIISSGAGMIGGTGIAYVGLLAINGFQNGGSDFQTI